MCEEISGPFIVMYHVGRDFPGLRGAEILEESFAIEARTGADGKVQRIHYALFTYRDVIDLAQGKKAAGDKFKESLLPSCSRQDKTRPERPSRGDGTK